MSGPYPDVVVVLNEDEPKVMHCCHHFHRGEKIVLQDFNFVAIESFDVRDVVPEIERFSSESTAGLDWQDQLVCCLVKISGDTLLVGNTWWGSRFAISLKHRKPVLPDLWEDEILLAERNLVLQALVAYDKDLRHSELHRRLETQADALYQSEGLIRLAGDLRIAELIPCLQSIERWASQQTHWNYMRDVSFCYLQKRRTAQIALRKLGQSPRYPCTQICGKPDFEVDPDSYAAVRSKVFDIRPGADFDRVYEVLGPPDYCSCDDRQTLFQYDIEADVPISVVLFRLFGELTINQVKHYRPPLWVGPQIFSRVGSSICQSNEISGPDLGAKYLGSVTEILAADQKAIINLDLVPSSVRQAAELLASSLSDNEREYFRITPVETLVGNYAGALRQGWSLSEMNTPLQRDAIKHYSIAHADDVSNLIVHWARAMVLGEDFYPAEHCERYHEHWARLGTTSMEAAGWKNG